jgi:acyl dehydratase
MTLVVPTPAELSRHVGETLGPTDWVTIDAERLARFEEATAAPAGDEADSYLTLSLANLFLPDLLTVETFSMGVNVGLEQVRFPRQVPVGARIRGRGEVLSAAEVGEGVQVVVRITIEVDGEDEPACVADTVSRFFP